MHSVEEPAALESALYIKSEMESVNGTALMISFLIKILIKSTSLIQVSGHIKFIYL